MKFNFLNKIKQAPNGPEARQALTIFFACLLIASMMLSPFLLSISMWGLVAVGLWQSAVSCREQGIVRNARTVAAWRQILVWSFRRLFQRPPLALLLLLLAAPTLSCFWSADLAYWLRRVQTRLPFLVLPWVFANLPPLSGRQMRLVLYAFVWMLLLVCLGIAVHFALHFHEIVAGIGRGDPIPVPRSHIRFSLILAIGIVSGAWLWAEGFYWRSPRERWALAATTVFLFLFIHVLSVRSGILGLYAMLLFGLGWYVWHTRRWVVGALALGIVVAAPIVAMKTLPSFRMRVHYMIWDWQQYQQNTGGAYSDAERIVSLHTGWQLWRANPVFGVGTGDLPTEVQRVTKEQYPQYSKEPKLPHNQFLYILAGTGVFGLALSLVAFFAPLATPLYRRFFLFSTFQILVFSSFMVEYTIETAIGVAFYLFFTLWFMKMAEVNESA